MSDCPLSVERLAAALRGINHMVLQSVYLDETPEILTELQQKMTTYNTESSKRLATSIGILVRISIILMSLAFTVPTAGTGTPISLGGIF